MGSGCVCSNYIMIKNIYVQKKMGHKFFICGIIFEFGIGKKKINYHKTLFAWGDVTKMIFITSRYYIPQHFLTLCAIKQNISYSIPSSHQIILTTTFFWLHTICLTSFTENNFLEIIFWKFKCMYKQWKC